MYFYPRKTVCTAFIIASCITPLYASVSPVSNAGHAEYQQGLAYLNQTHTSQSYQHAITHF